ncbi:MAG: tetratricopeptide repeat protein [Limisphaerales bacterium]
MSPETDNSRRFRLVAGALAIVALIFLVYLPVLPGSFVMDDARLTGGDNPLVNGNLNLRTLWFGTDFTLATFAWWLERMAFGANPMGYHLVDLMLQALASLALWRLLARLKIPGAWLAAALFAIHPVCVNSVARISEQKNTLCLPFFLLSFIAWLRYEALALYPVKTEPDQPPSRLATLWLCISLLAFMAALLAKTTAAMLPVVLLLCAAWQRNRIAWKDVLHTLPYFALSLAFGLMSVWFQKNQALAGIDAQLVPTTFWQRLAASGNDFWFYLGKAVFPVHLSVAYARQPVDAKSFLACLPLLGIVAALLLCWRFRRSWGRQVLFALACFGVTLFPALGFFDAQYLTMWNVSDHLQYNSLPAIVALVTAGLAVWLKKAAFPAVGAVLLAAFSILSFQRAHIFVSEENIVRDTLQKNPQSWAAHNDFGTILARKNDYAGAAREFALSLQSNPANLEARMNLGHALSLLGRYDEAEGEFQAALKMAPGNAPMRQAYAEALAKEGKSNEALEQLQLAVILHPSAQAAMELGSWYYAAGNMRKAAASLRRALDLGPDNPEALNNLAWVLATSPDDSLRNGKEALTDAERACQLTSYRRPEMLSALAAAQAETGDFPQAIATIQSAMTIATAAGNTQLANAGQHFLQSYRAGKPWRQAR